MGKAEALRLAVTQAADALLTVTLAPVCAACDRVLDSPLAGPVCDRCWAGVVPIREMCRTDEEPLASWRAAGEYEGSLREIIQAFKYDGRRSLAKPLAAMMLEAGADVLQGADMIVPVPLHPWRRLQRGFNQSSELARRLEMPVVHALWRTRATVPQSGLHPAERRRNVKAAFRLSPLPHVALRDRCVVLVDDVRTTGATLNACARVLKDAGAREVRAVTVARAAPQ